MPRKAPRSLRDLARLENETRVTRRSAAVVAPRDRGYAAIADCRSMVRSGREWRKGRVRLVMMLLGVALGAAAQGAEPQTLVEGSWVCATPQAHDEAVASERNGQDPQALEVELRARCIRMTSERLAEVMAPFVAVVERIGDKARVSFITEVYERGATGAEAQGTPQPRGGLNRQIKYVGWTAAVKLRAQ